MFNRSKQLTDKVYPRAKFKTGRKIVRKTICGLVFFMSLSVQASPSVIQVYTEEYPPFNFSDSSGAPAGESTSLVQSMMKAAGLEFKITFVPWARALKFAADNKNSCVYSTSRTPERESTYHWIGPLATNQWTVFGNATEQKRVKKIEDLKSEKVGSYLGDAIVHYLKDRQIEVVEAHHDEANISMIKSGRIKFWATGKLNGQALLNRVNEKEIVPLFDFNKTQMYLACGKHIDQTVIVKLNEAFKKIKPAP